jgi:superfamily I DNA/RNA helicase
MDRIHTEWSLLLSTSFRYGQPVADLASSLLTQSKKQAVKITGHVSRFTTISSQLTDDFVPDVVICRTNEGALMQAIEHMNAGRNVKLRHSTTSAELLKKIQAVQQVMKTGYTRLHRDYEDFTRKTFVEYLETEQGKSDKTLLSLLDKFGMTSIENVLNNGAKKRKDVVEIITAHRSKGLEWENVMLGHDFPETEEGYEQDQEANLLYVAMTRCKARLDISLCPHLVELSGGESVKPVTTVERVDTGVISVMTGEIQSERMMVTCTSCQQDKCQHIGADYSKQGHPWRHNNPQPRWCNDFTHRQ